MIIIFIKLIMTYFKLVTLICLFNFGTYICNLPLRLLSLQNYFFYRTWVAKSDIVVIFKSSKAISTNVKKQYVC